MAILAYLDPGSGSMLVGAAAAGAAGAAVAAKSLVHKFKSPFRKKGAADPDTLADDAEAAVVEETTES